MVDDVVHLVGCEFMQNGYRYATISECGKKCYGPVCTVATGERYFVTLHDAAVFKHDVEFLYLPCNVVILKCCALKVGQGILVPIVYNRLLYQTIEMLCLIHNLVFAFMLLIRLLLRVGSSGMCFVKHLAQIQKFCAKIAHSLHIPKLYVHLIGCFIRSALILPDECAI